MDCEDCTVAVAQHVMKTARKLAPGIGTLGPGGPLMQLP